MEHIVWIQIKHKMEVYGLILITSCQMYQKGNPLCEVARKPLIWLRTIKILLENCYNSELMKHNFTKLMFRTTKSYLHCDCQCVKLYFTYSS